MYKNPEPNDELLECFDEQGNVAAPHTRQEVHTDPLQFWQGVANIWLVNKKSEIACSKRSESLSGNPGKWQTYFGGHVKAGESFRQTAVTELDEEVGLQVKDSDLILIDKGRHEPAKHFYESYTCLFNGDIADLKFNDGEIVEARWLGMETYLEEKQLHPENWCNGCNFENQVKIRQFVEKVL
jgi:isopentenyldiphosphate isomerase